ncbi:ATP-binding cassette domain-containing protein [Saccharopolyspora sp. ID03-671]|uniref:ABC transporter ATP-binding protein n=1 Tax=Saccharopolyspora sp. ID03-671 TaxID=3073066 RepID=UPI0032520869
MQVRAREEDHPTELDDDSGPARNAAVVDLERVSVDVERTSVLRGLSLEVLAGECLGVVGANGSGKSTLLSVIATLRPINAGSGTVLGVPLGSLAVRDVRRRISLVGHVPALYPQLTLRENLRFVGRLLGRSDALVDEALGEVGLARAAHRTADRCSQGMLRRADLARVLLTEPDLLLLDEVYSGLDVTATGLVDGLISEVRRRAGAAVVVSHDMHRLDAVADRTVRVVRGSTLPATSLERPG